MRAFGEMDTQTVRLVGTNFLESIVYQCLNPVTHGFQVWESSVQKVLEKFDAQRYSLQ